VAARSALAALLPPFAVGAALRLYRIDSQLPFGDELHAVRVVALHPLRTIVTSWFEADPSPPLAALYELLVLAGVGLDERVLRAPSLLCGLAALFVIPLAIRNSAPRLAVPLAWMLALAPGLALYSRIARPYMPVALLGFVAALSFFAWWRRPSAGSGGLFVVSAATTLWLFIGTAPYVAAFFVFAAAAELPRLRRGPGWRPLLGLGLALSFAVALFLVPGRESFLELLRTKPTGSPPGLRSTLEALQLLAGTRTPATAALFWLLALAGLLATAKRDAPLALFSALAVAAQLGGMLLLAPVGIANPVVFARYLLVGLPLILCWVAAGLVELGDRSRSRFGLAAGALVPAVAVVALFLAGPFTDRALYSTSFLSSEEYLGFHVPRSRLPATAIPAIYHQLGESDERGPVLEYTGSAAWSHLNHLAVYQEIHRRQVLFSPQDDHTPFAPGMSLRNLVRPDPEAFLASPARFLVVHHHTAREVDRLKRPGSIGLWPFGRANRQRARLMGQRIARRLERSWGPPGYVDEDVSVWDLSEVRARAGSSESLREPDRATPSNGATIAPPPD
jgi:hypothetical protein